LIPQAGADADASGAAFLLVLAVIVPTLGSLATFALPSRHAWRLSLATMLAGLAIAAFIVVALARTGEAPSYILGGWRPPLGIALRADGLSAAMLAMTAIVLCAAGLFARAQFGIGPSAGEKRLQGLFWPLLFANWSALNLVYVAGDLFSLYVALELLTVAAVPLVCLEGRGETIAAALRYLLFALLGSLFYLLGTALVYGAFGTLDIRLLSQAASPRPALTVALALMIAGLAAKAALFPLHLWLPRAHAGAPAAASAILSALVVKAPFFLILRLVFDVAPAATGAAAGRILAALGACAIVYCSVLAIRQERLKLMIAYSTAAQVGYLFLVFPLAAGTEAVPPWASVGWTGGALQLVSHAFAKAAMFLAAGVVAETFGHDRLASLGGFGRVLPISAATFALAGLSLVGLPPSGGFIAKCLLLTAAVVTDHPWLVGAIVAGSLLSAAYVFRIVAPALASPAAPLKPIRQVPRSLEAIALALALVAVALGFVPLQPFGFLGIGRSGLAVAP
jgi:formate hydrogenlyase subunit 3/multisubunit Na+/H+ antiporter MnhD subunit